METFNVQIDKPLYGKGWSSKEIETKGFTLSNVRMGVSVEYGAVCDSDGQQLWDQPRIVSGGGSCLATFAIINGMLYLGLDIDLRPISERMFYQFVRGFSDIVNEAGFESALNTIEREFVEETDILMETGRIFPLEDQTLDGYNMDTAWFCHPNSQGVKYFGLMFDQKELVACGDGTFEIDPEVVHFMGKKKKELSRLIFCPYGPINPQIRCGITKLGVFLLKEKLSL